MLPTWEKQIVQPTAAKFGLGRRPTAQPVKASPLMAMAFAKLIPLDHKAQPALALSSRLKRYPRSLDLARSRCLALLVLEVGNPTMGCGPQWLTSQRTPTPWQRGLKPQRAAGNTDFF